MLLALLEHAHRPGPGLVPGRLLLDDREGAGIRRRAAGERRARAGSGSGSGKKRTSALAGLPLLWEVAVEAGGPTYHLYATEVARNTPFQGRPPSAKTQHSGASGTWVVMQAV